MITPILAVGDAVSVSPLQIGEFVVILLVVLGGYMRLRKFEDRIAGRGAKIEITNQPIETTEKTVFATKQELAAAEQKLNEEDHQLHGRISSVRNELTAKVDGLDARIDAIPQRTIELLKTIKEYHKQ